MQLSTEVEKFLLAGLSPCDQVKVCKQLETLKEGGIIQFPKGGWVKLKGGQIVASGSPGSTPPSS